MISRELNETITRTGPGTDAGAVMRRYWQPAALADELQGKRPVVPVKLLARIWCCFATRRASWA
jgi:hypothetical protein